jgi:uncharacterized Zn-binding protein involved in type VI secretion
MAAAARVGDDTGHRTPLSGGLGSPNVFIGGMPAWRTCDVHTCPLSTGTKPHVGGMVTQGSSKVFINGFPAARQGDTIAESGETNAISGGFMKVQIGG